MPRLAPSVISCSIAAGRYGSAATSSGRRPILTMWRASFAAVVVLPEPCNPTSAMTAGFPERWSARSPPDRSAVSSSLTILTTCWPALSEVMTSAPIARSRTRAVKSLTTLKLTSASSSARRTSRMAVSTSASLIRPRPVSEPSVLRRRSERASNMAGRELLWTGVLATRQRRRRARGFWRRRGTRESTATMLGGPGARRRLRVWPWRLSSASAATAAERVSGRARPRTRPDRTAAGRRPSPPPRRT